MKLKHLPEDEQRKLREMLADAGIPWNPEQDEDEIYAIKVPMRLKYLPEEEQPVARAVCEKLGIPWNGEMRLEELRALSQAAEEDLREIAELEQRVVDSMEEVNKLLELHLPPAMDAQRDKLPVAKLIYFLKPREIQQRALQLEAQIEADLVTLQHRDPELRSKILHEGLDPGKAYLQVPW